MNKTTIDRVLKPGVTGEVGNEIWPKMYSGQTGSVTSISHGEVGVHLTRRSGVAWFLPIELAVIGESS